MDRPHSNPSMATVAESVEALRQSANTKSPFNYFDINILVVDDDVTTLAIVSAMLRTWSYQVVSFKNPIDALATLRKKKCSFDIVVTDLHMPQMNGFELQKHVHEEFKLPVIMMSADDKESMILKGLEGGVADYIVKPVSKDDIRNVWRHAVAAKNGKSSNISIEEIESAPKESPGEVEDTSNSVTASDGEGKQDKFEFKVNKSRKRSRNLEEDHDDQPLIATKKSKVVWTNSLHNKFLLAIRHIGLEKAVPKRILEFMNVPGLTRENVASHLQKYRMFLKRVSERAKSSRCCLAQERVMRSRFASGHSPLVFRSLMPDHHHEYPQYQMGRPSSTIIQSGNSTPLALAANSNYNLGSSMNIQFPPPPSQQASFASSSSSMPRLINGSGQSRLLNNINQPMQLVGNGSYLLPQVPNRRAFGMQQRLNNVGNDGAGMPYGLVNGTNYGLTNGANLVPMYPQHAQAQGNQLQGLNFTTNPFSYNFATPGIQSTNYASTNIDNIGSSFNNVNQLAPSSSYLVSSNFAGTQMSSSGSRELVGLMGQPRLVNNYMNGGEYPNGLINSQINGLTNEVRNINLTSATVAPMGNITGINNSGNYMAQGVSSSSTGFDQTATYQFPRPAVFPTNNNIQQQNNALNQIGLPSNAGGGNIDNSYGGLMNSSSTTTTAPTLINNNISLEQQEFVGDNNDDDMMISNLFMHQINNYQPPPNYQQKGADGLHANLSSISYQAEAPKLTANQVLNPNPSVNQVVEPTVNGQVLQEPTANQVGNPGFSGSYRVQVNAPNQQSESQQQGGEQVFNQEFQGGNSVFQSEDYNHIFDQQDFDDDFMNAILGSGSGPY